MNEGSSGWGLKDYISIGGILVTALTGAMWVGTLSQRVETLESRADLSDDVASIKTQLSLFDRQLDRMEGKIDRLPRAQVNQ